jgi:hypothetical protein
MPNPTASDLHVNGLLGDLSVAYMNSDASFAAAQVFPYVDVQKQTDVYGIYDRGDFLRDGMQRRGPFDVAAQGGYNVTTSDYACEVWSEAILVSDRQRANADDPYRPDEDGAVWLAQQRLIRQEVDWASNFFTTSVWISTPLEDVDAQNDAIEGRTGKRANVLVLNRKGWSALRHHPDIVDRVKGTGGNTNPAMVSKQAVAELMELDKIVVTSAVRNTAAEGATASVSYIAGNHALLAYAASSPGLFEPSGGYIFRWTGLAGQAGGGQGISTYRDDDRKCDRHEIEAAWDCKVAAPLVGAFFQSVA